MPILLSALLFVVLTSISGSVSAQSTKGGWAATACINMPRATSPATNEARGDYYRPEAGLENNTQNFAYVGCDVGTARGERRIYVDFMDANLTFPISCWLYSVAWNGVKAQIGAKASTAYNSVAYRGFFEFYVPPTNQGYLILTCQLPPSTSLLGWNSVTLAGE